MKVKFTLSRNGCYRREVMEVEKVGRDEVDDFVLREMPSPIRTLFAQGWQLEKWQPYWVKGAKAAKKPKPNGKVKKGGNPKSPKALAPKKFGADKPEWAGDAKRCADIISRIVGMGAKSRELARYSVDAAGLALAYRKGENPIDYLSKPIEAVRKPVLLVSPDTSGSCTGFADFTVGFSQQLAKHYEVFLIENFNGAVDELPKGEINLVLYIGDTDYFQTSSVDGGNFALKDISGARVIGLCNYASNYRKPQVCKDRSKKTLTWIDHVSLKDPKAYVLALEAAVKHIIR